MTAAEGFGLRAVKGEVAGYAHSTEISEAALLRAAETARLAVGDGWRHTGRGADGHQHAALYRRRSDGGAAEFGVKLETLAEIDAFCPRARPARGAGLRPRWRPPTRRWRSCAPRAGACATCGPWCG